MNRFITALAPIALVGAVLLACGLGEKTEQLRTMTENLEDAARQLESGDTTAAEDALGRVLGGGAAVEPVDFRSLRALLPESLPGLERTEAEGETSRVMGISTSKAEGHYAATDGQGRIDVTLTDLGSVRGIGMFGVNWLMVEVDKESDRGYERTLSYEGYPAYEKFEQGSDWSRGERSVFVADRFIVTVSGQNVADEALREALSRIDLDALEAMREEGVTPES